MNLQALKFNARVKLADAMGMFLPETVKARLSGLGEPPQIGDGATLANLQYALRVAERGEPYYINTFYRDMIRNDSHIQAEMRKRIMSFMGQAETIEPIDPDNPDDVQAKEMIEDMIANCDNWIDGSTHLALGHIWPVVAAEKIYEPVNGEDQWKFRHRVNYRLKKLHAVPYALFTYKVAYYNLNTIGTNPLGGPVPQSNLTMSGMMPIQQTQGPQALQKNLVAANNNPALVWNPEDWHPDLRFYGTYDGTGMIDWSMSNCYKPDPTRHIIHSSDVATAGLRENLTGVLQSLTPWWLFTQCGRDWWARFMERYASPFAVAYANTSNKNIFDILSKAFNQATKTNALIVPPQCKIELKECNATGGADAYAKFIEVCNTEKTKALVGQTLSTSSKGSGMMGGSGVADLHAEVREEWTVYDKRTYCDMQRKQLFDDYLRINGCRGRCKSSRGGVSTAQLRTIADSLQKLQMAGVAVDPSEVQKMSNIVGVKMRIFKAEEQKMKPDGEDDKKKSKKFEEIESRMADNHNRVMSQFEAMGRPNAPAPQPVTVNMPATTINLPETRIQQNPQPINLNLEVKPAEPTLVKVDGTPPAINLNVAMQPGQKKSTRIVRGEDGRMIGIEEQ